MPVRAAFTVRCGRSPKSLSLEENAAAVQVAVISLCIRGYQKSPWREAIKALALPLSSCAVTPLFQRGNNLAALSWRIYHIIIRPALSISVVWAGVRPLLRLAKRRLRRLLAARPLRRVCPRRARSCMGLALALVSSAPGEKRYWPAYRRPTAKRPPLSSYSLRGE